MTQTRTNDELSTALTTSTVYFLLTHFKMSKYKFQSFKFFPFSEKSFQSENTYIKSFLLSEKKDNEIFVAIHDFFDQFSTLLLWFAMIKFKREERRNR